VSQAVSCRILTAKGSGSMPGQVCEVCIGQSGTGIEFSLSTFTHYHSFEYHSTNARHSSSSEYCNYEEDRRVTLGTLKRKGTRFWILQVLGGKLLLRCQ